MLWLTENSTEAKLVKNGMKVSIFTLNGKFITVCDVGNDPSECYVNRSVSREAYCIDRRRVLFFFFCVSVSVCVCVVCCKADNRRVLLFVC